MATLKWLLTAFAVIMLVVALLRKRFGVNKAFCCALCIAACTCAVMMTLVWRWMPQTHRPIMRMEALREDSAPEDANKHIWLRNVFSIFGDRSIATFTELKSGTWAEAAEGGLRWQAESGTGDQADVLEISAPAAERYAVFFLGNRNSGKALLTYPDTGISEVIDTYRDSDDWQEIVVDIGLNGAAFLRRMRWALAVGTAGCAAVSALLFFVLYRALRKRRASVQAFERKLSQVWPGRAPLNPRVWKWFPFTLCAIFAIPMVLIGVYAGPWWDDFAYGALTRHVWRQTGSLVALLRAAIEVSKQYYDTWQGSFSSLFVMALQPAIFGERWYAITPYLMIAWPALGTWMFARTVLYKKQGAVLCWLAMYLSIQFVPAPDQVFYWYNAGIYYVFFYSLSLILYSIVLRTHRTGSRIKRVVYTAVACLLAFFIGGGNYVTALLSCVLLALLIGYRIFQRDKQWWLPLLVLLCMLSALLYSAVAPGNAFRQSMSHQMSPAGAILTSFPHAWDYLVRSMRAEFILGTLFALPFLYQAAERSAYPFKYPGLITILSFGAYSCQFIPHLFAAGVVGPTRLTAIIFFSNFWLIGGNLFYWFGWFIKRGSITETIRVLVRWGAVTAAMLMAFACIWTIVREPRAMNGTSAAMSLADGSARKLGEALDARLAILEDESVRDAVLPALPVVPPVLTRGDFADVVDFRSSIVGAEYYEKDSLRVVGLPE